MLPFDKVILPHTYKEIVKYYHSEIWNPAKECISELEKWQKLLIELIPSVKTALPTDAERRTSEKAQIALLNYLKLRSLYGLAHEIGEQVNHWCHELGVSGNIQDDEGVNETKAVLTDLFEAFGKVDAVDIAHDNLNGFQKLEQAVDSFVAFHDFLVMRSYHDGVQWGNWTFHDITGNIGVYGLQSDALWESVLHDTVPTDPNVSGLMESEEDNKVVRLY